jgi:hypothetical protein
VRIAASQTCQSGVWCLRRLNTAPLAHHTTASDKVADETPCPAIMDCGGKRSATPLWVGVTQGVELGALYWQGKRRRASLAAAFQSDIVTGPAHRKGRIRELLGIRRSADILVQCR